MHNTCSATSTPNRVTVASCSIEIWPFEFCEISTFHGVWTLVITFLEGNSKIGLRQAVDLVPQYHINHHWAPRESGGGDRPRSMQLYMNNINSNAPRPWSWPWIGSWSHQRTQYVQDYPHAQPCDCSVKHYRNMAIWISWNIDIPRSLNSGELW